MALPLDGRCVIELGSNVAGPYAGWILGALGAEVIKVERPGGGDDARGWGPPFWGDASALFQSINTNKRSLSVDYKDPAQVAKLKALILERADIVVQNLRPRVLSVIGLDGATLLAEKPSLIYCNLHAFGAHGPMSDKPGYDALMQAYGGLMSVTGEEDGNPVRTGNSSIDMGTGTAAWHRVRGARRRSTKNHQPHPAPAPDRPLRQAATPSAPHAVGPTRGPTTAAGVSIGAAALPSARARAAPA